MIASNTTIMNTFIHIIHICVYIYIYIYVHTNIRHHAFSGEACELLLCTLVVLEPLFEILANRSLGFVVLGNLFWVGPGPEVGHGGNCLRDPTPPLSVLLAFAHCYPVRLESNENQHFQEVTEKCTS